MDVLHIFQIILICIGIITIIGAVRILVTGVEDTLGETMLKLFCVDWIAAIFSNIDADDFFD